MADKYFEIGQRVLWVRRVGRDTYPLGVGIVRHGGDTVYMDFNPPAVDPRHPANPLREGHDKSRNVFTESEVRAAFICQTCGGEGCGVCNNTGGAFESYPLVKLFLRME